MVCIAVALLRLELQVLPVLQHARHSSSCNRGLVLLSLQVQDKQTSTCRVTHTIGTADLSPGHSCSSQNAVHLAQRENVIFHTSRV